MFQFPQVSAGVTHIFSFPYCSVWFLAGFPLHWKLCWTGHSWRWNIAPDCTHGPSALLHHDRVAGTLEEWAHLLMAYKTNPDLRADEKFAHSFLTAAGTPGTGCAFRCGCSLLVALRSFLDFGIKLSERASWLAALGEHELGAWFTHLLRHKSIVQLLHGGHELVNLRVLLQSVSANMGTQESCLQTQV